MIMHRSKAPTAIAAGAFYYFQIMMGNKRFPVEKADKTE